MILDQNIDDNFDQIISKCKLDLIRTVKFVKQLFRIQIQKGGKVLLWTQVKSRMEACYSELVLTSIIKITCILISHTTYLAKSRWLTNFYHLTLKCNSKTRKDHAPAHQSKSACQSVLLAFIQEILKLLKRKLKSFHLM